MNATNIYQVVNAVVWVFVTSWIVWYLMSVRALAKKLQQVNPQLFKERYCDRITGSYLIKGTLKDDVMDLKSVPPTVKSLAEVEFRVAHKRFVWCGILFFIGFATTLSPILWRRFL